MKLNYLIGFIILLISSTAQADNNNCPVILKQSANAWANQQSSTPDIENALSQYGQCVDNDIDQMEDKLYKTNTNPLMNANSDFRAFTTALNNFTDLALKLSAEGGTYDRIHTGYTKLYQKQFKLDFYYYFYSSSYCPTFTCAPDHLLKRFKSQQQLQHQVDLKELKAYFEKTLLTYPPKQREELQQAFTQMMSQSANGAAVQKSVYLYAIFALEPPSGKVFPDPF